MNSVDLVKALCKERKIPVSKLERDLGFSNGYIGQLRRGSFPADRLAAIADYFGVTTDYLLDNEKAPAETGKRITDEDIKFALFGGDGEITDSMYEEVRSFAAFVKRREEQKKKG